MKKIKYILIVLMMFLFMGYAKADSAPDNFTLGIFIESCHANHGTNCAFSENTNPGYFDQNSTVFCLDPSINTYSGSSYTRVDSSRITGSSFACVVWDAINAGYISEPTSDGTYYYRTFASDFTNGVINTNALQWKIWDGNYTNTYDGNSISASNCVITRTTPASTGTLSVTQNVPLSKKTIGGTEYYAGTIAVSYSNLSNGRYNITNSNSNLIVSESESGSAVSSSDKTTLYVRIPVANVNATSSYSITFSANYLASNSVTLTPIMEYYTSGSYQPMGILGLKRESTSTNGDLTAKSTLSVSVTPKLILKKVEIDNNGVEHLLKNAKMKVTKNGSYLGEYTLASGSYTLEGDDITVGEYCVTEVVAPDGYILSTDTPKCVTLSATNLSAEIKMVNEPTRVRFKKVWYDSVSKEYMPVSNAEFKIVDAAGVTVKDSEGKEIVWTTDGSTHEIKRLKPGKYSVVETKVPDGYTKVKNIDFEIKDDGSVVSEALESKLNIMDKNELTIVIKEEQTVTKFSKQDATTGKELPGATLQILDSNKKPILDKDGKELYKWVSTNKPHIIEGLPAGKYYLKETIAPAGYQLSTEMVSFEVKEDGTVTQVVMKNKPEEVPDVPDTGKSNMSMLMLGGSLVLVASLGLLIYTIVRRKKANV